MNFFSKHEVDAELTHINKHIAVAPNPYRAMGEKRKHGSAFQVGPANLPDGTRKRKADRIKQALIDRAKIKHDFEKVKKRKLQEEADDSQVPRPNVYENAEDEAEGEALSAAPHPDRQALIDGTAEPPQDDADGDDFARRRDLSSLVG